MQPKKEKKEKRPRRGGRIRNRVFLYLIAFVIFLLIVLYLFQIVFLDDFYRFFKTESLQASADAIAANIDNEDIQTLADRISQDSDICVLAVDEGYNPVLTSDIQPGCIIHHIAQRDLIHYCKRMAQENGALLETFSFGGFRNYDYKPDRFTGRVPQLNENKAESMIYARMLTLADGSTVYLFLNAIITPVTATVDTLRGQLAVIIVILLLLALVIALLMSKRITGPIIGTNAAAKQLSKGQYTPPAGADSYREISELNETLAQTAKDLGQVERLQHELIANISHDLRTPLTMIGGYAEVMRDIPSENTPENMQIIIDETKRLSTLVNAVMDYSKLQSGRQEINRTDYNLTASLRELMGRYEKLKEQDGYRISLNAEQDVWINGDEAKLTQVICNLINNAISYTGDDKTVKVVQQVANGQTTISIIDTGVGIPPDELDNIWDRYYRVTENHKRAVVGSGLGLSIVKGILSNHGFEYGVESEVGKGSRFYFAAPVVQAKDGGR